MANNLIQIKRSLTTAQPGSLANGELAYTANGDVLFVGSNGSIKAIGGARTPGTLTANQALVANATGWLDSVKSANLVIEKVYANGEFGTSGFVLASGGNGSNAYWVSTGTLAVSPGGSNTQVQFNDSGTLAASAGFTFNKTSNTLNVSNTITVGANVSLNTSTLTAPSASITNASITKVYANGAHGTDGQLLYSNSTGGLYWGSVGSSVNTLDDLTDVAVATPSAGQILVSNSTGVFRNVSLSGDITVNADGVVSIAADSVTLGTDTTGDYVASITAGNGISGSGTGEGSTPTIAVVAGGGIVSNSTGVFANVDGTTLELSGGAIQVKDDSITLGTKTTGNYVATITAGSGLSGNATTEGSTPTIAVVAGSGIASNSTGVHVVAGTGVVSNATGVHIGQPVATTDNVTFNDITINGNTTIGSATSDVVSITARVSSSIVPSANVTYDLGTSALRWKDLYLAGSTIVLGNSSISDVSGTLTLGNTSVTDFTSTGNTVLGSNTSDVVTFNGLVNSNIIPAANATYSFGNNTSRWYQLYAANVHSEYGYFDRDVSISGNLTITGTLTTVNANNLSVTDSLIQLAANNTASDVLDIGLFGSYQFDGGDHEHTGIFRDATDDKWKIFKGLLPSPTTTVDTSNNTYQTATLVTYLESSALQTNATAVAISANSTVSVSITANSITLATALAGTSGGTGLSSYTVEDILVANSSNGFRKLGLGSDGYILQSNGTALVYGTLDGGTF
jgi:hypothetical protein